MSRADEIRAKAQRTRERREQAPQERPAPAAPVVRAKPVRKTVDLPPQRYADLTAWCSETAGDLGVARVTGQDVLNALAALLLRDPEVAQQIRHDLAHEFRQRAIRRKT